MQSNRSYGTSSESVFTNLIAVPQQRNLMLELEYACNQREANEKQTTEAQGPEEMEKKMFNASVAAPMEKVRTESAEKEVPEGRRI